MTKPDPTTTIISATSDALAYVLSSWGRGFEQSLPATPSAGFLRSFAKVQASIISRSQVLTAMIDDRIVGFIVSEPGQLHWVQTRQAYRTHGIGSALLAAADLNAPAITSWTIDLRHLGLSRAPYIPFWLRQK